MTRHETLLNEATKAILAVATDDSVCYSITVDSLVELENVIHEMILRNYPGYHETSQS